MQHDLSFFDKSNLKWLKNNTIFLTIHGSHSYGTNIETSDIDYRGIAIAPREFYFGFENNFEQQVFKEPDATIFDLRKFFNLAANCNPNALEIIFTDPEHHLIVHPIMKKLFDNREKFLTQRARHTFYGYSCAQLKRINNHYKWLSNVQEKMPERKDFGLDTHAVIPREQLEAADAAITKQLDQWNPDFSSLHKDVRQEVEQKITTVLNEIGAASIYINKNDLWKEAALSAGFNPNIILLLKKEREYRSKLNEWNSYQEWIINRNATRAQLEKNHGYDTKHALHLVRLCRVCMEILTEGKLLVKRPDAKELLEIRNGKCSYDELIAYSDKMKEEIDNACKNSRLPYSPDREFLNKLCSDMIQEFLEEQNK